MNIEGTNTTPAISIEPGLIRIIGRSIPEDSAEFYEPVLAAVHDYIKRKEAHTEIHIHLEYINSGSKKYITNTLGVCNESFLSGQSISVQWLYDYDDESMEELGNDLRNLLNIPFEIREIN